MADPRQIEAGTGRRNLDRRVSWSANIHVGRSDRGDEVTHQANVAV